uniref:AlNc14C62G4506 protein n=1 Tax=Albugo laibachii Nc14 TaxID=890382 RepID=F0WCY1_9STRA|nr:AlNc14C62G4506 [Albugo laibachii Nc14]|eukprot:CCA19052.1 AlNc14C62G4506 [Albugo laibachii Nc14]
MLSSKYVIRAPGTPYQAVVPVDPIFRRCVLKMIFSYQFNALRRDQRCLLYVRSRPDRLLQQHFTAMVYIERDNGSIHEGLYECFMDIDQWSRHMDTIGITMNVADFSSVLEDSLKKPNMVSASIASGESSVQVVIRYQLAETIIRKGRVDLRLLEPKSDACTNALQSLLIGIHHEKHTPICTIKMEISMDEVNVDQKCKDNAPGINEAPTCVLENSEQLKRPSIADPVLRQRKRTRGAKLLHQM